MAKKREYTWYLEPRGDVARSNEVLGKNLGEENAFQGVECADGVRRNLWRCPSAMVFMLWSSRKTLRIVFGIFCQEGKGKIRRATRWYGKTVSKPRKGSTYV
ncbi:MAG: hypothetical protein A2401_00425 [Candidatus Staskawiczbacteria bacterium RIFOXYC1_FULL_38_18]|uniref:Uncharacterized protein n=1 Tax=Candidatus Staskawiczbacteria bacterium RIFOXYC1_FULL_38_18 TaxID=1802229 RepID=A0A1G2J996_9BACT|nr:MAG: hypothetical protein A2401_00425 [Candidatus Staskawiczbacteria bacterium RIFOXYC1_FULL_38_18]